VKKMFISNFELQPNTSYNSLLKFTKHNLPSIIHRNAEVDLVTLKKQGGNHQRIKLTPAAGIIVAGSPSWK